jgi:uncharacterized protein (TIRG00374 family)
MFFFLFLLLLAAILAAAAVIAFLCSRNYRTRYPRLNNILENFTGGFGYFRSNREAVFKFGAYHVLSIFLLAVRLYFSFAAIGVKIPPLKLLVIQSLTGFSMVLSLTPGNLGIKEGIITFSAGLLQLSPDTAMLSAMLDRAAAMVVVFSLGLIFSHLLLRDLPKGLQEVRSGAGPEG